MTISTVAESYSIPTLGQKFDVIVLLVNRVFFLKSSRIIMEHTVLIHCTSQLGLRHLRQTQTVGSGI